MKTRKLTSIQRARLAGSTHSKAKARAARINGKKGGRPKGTGKKKN